MKYSDNEGNLKKKTSDTSSEVSLNKFLHSVHTGKAAKPNNMRDGRKTVII